MLVALTAKKIDSKIAKSCQVKENDGLLYTVTRELSTMTDTNFMPFIIFMIPILMLPHLKVLRWNIAIEMVGTMVKIWIKGLVVHVTKGFYS